MIIDLSMTALLQSLALALVVYGIMIPFKLLNFADLTAEGTYPLGGAICATLITAGIHPGIGICIAVLASGVVGMVTALIHIRLRVNTLLAGIIVSTMLYSVNLRIMGSPNISLFGHYTLINGDEIFVKITTLLSVILLVAIIPLMMFLKTEYGLRLRAVGLNQAFAKKQNISVVRYTLLGLFLGNCYAGLAGSIIVQMQGYMDIGIGVCIVIHALAALMIGEAILNPTTITKQLLAPLIGAVVYQQIQGLALLVGLAPSDLRLFTGGALLVVLMLKNSTKRYALA